MHLLLSFYFLIIRPPPSSTLFPYTTLFRSRPPTPMTRHRIAQIGENRNPKSPENRPQTRRFLQIRLLQLRRSATPFNGLAVLHGRLLRDRVVTRRQSFTSCGFNFRPTSRQCRGS